MSRHPEGGQGTGRGVSAAAPAAPAPPQPRPAPRFPGLQRPPRPTPSRTPSLAARCSGAPGRNTPSAAVLLVAAPGLRDGNHALGGPFSVVPGASCPCGEPTPPHSPLPANPAGLQPGSPNSRRARRYSGSPASSRFRWAPRSRKGSWSPASRSWQGTWVSWGKLKGWERGPGAGQLVCLTAKRIK